MTQSDSWRQAARAAPGRGREGLVCVYRKGTGGDGWGWAQGGERTNVFAGARHR